MMNMALTAQRIRNKFFKEWHKVVSSDLPVGFFDGHNIATYRKLVKKIPDGGVFAELGSWKGRSICSLASIIKKKNLKVYCIDTFKGTIGEGEEQLVKEASRTDIEEEFLRNIGRFGIASHIKVIPATTESGLAQIHELLDMIFIDADHSYQAVREDISNALPHMKPHSIISGHDYTDMSVQKAVTELMGKVLHEDNIWWKILS